MGEENRQKRWENTHIERTTILTSLEKDEEGQTLKDRIKAAAAAEGVSVNAFILDAVKIRLDASPLMILADESLREAAEIAAEQAPATNTTPTRWLLDAAQAYRDI